MTAVAFAIEIPLRLLSLRLFSQAFPDQAAIDSNVGWMLSQSLYTVPADMSPRGSPLGVGWLTPSRWRSYRNC